MAAPSVNAGNVNNLGQFTRLRAAARAQDPQALKAAARQFEALFTQQLFKSMRAAKVGDDLLGSDQGAMYQDMFDQQMAQHLSQGRGLGIADLLVRQLQHANLAKSSAIADGATTGASAAATMRALPATAETSTAASAAPPSDSLPPVQFIKTLLPHAEEAARELGIPAQTLVAQAALETGWGRHQMKNADGTPSYNFFGIKADSRWNGGRVSQHTTEYVQGSAQARTASFRSYGSPGEAFKDYVAFIKANPRYADALRHGGDGARYAEGLQKAGYATDPAYAQKIKKISAGPLMSVALASAPRTLTA